MAKHELAHHGGKQVRFPAAGFAREHEPLLVGARLVGVEPLSYGHERGAGELLLEALHRAAGVPGGEVGLVEQLHAVRQLLAAAAVQPRNAVYIKDAPTVPRAERAWGPRHDLCDRAAIFLHDGEAFIPLQGMPPPRSRWP